MFPSLSPPRALLTWYMRDCGVLVCVQLACPSKAIQEWQAAGIPVVQVDTEEKAEKLEEKEKEVEEQ